MDTVARGATWTEVTFPIKNASGALVTDGLTGTPTVTLTTLRDSADVDRRTGGTLTYAGDGGYRVSKAIPSDGALGSWWGVVTYNDGAGFVRTYPFGFVVITAAQADPAAALSGATITYSGPVAQSGRVTIIRGGDYLVEDGLALPWSWTDAESIPDLTGATITFTAQSEAFQQTLTATGEVVDASGATKAVRVELTSVQTSSMSEEATGAKIAWTYVLRATLAGSGNVVPLAAGPMTVL